MNYHQPRRDPARNELEPARLDGWQWLGVLVTAAGLAALAYNVGVLFGDGERIGSGAAIGLLTAFGGALLISSGDSPANPAFRWPIPPRQRRIVGLVLSAIGLATLAAEVLR